MVAFVKILHAQEIGQRSSGPRGAGQYVLIPKKSRNFFPSLNINIDNPQVTISINGSPTSYIYYNGRLHGTNTRNEYRFYLNEIINPNNLIASKDVVVLIKDKPSSYILHHIPFSDPRYSKFARLRHAYGDNRSTAALIPLTQINNALLNI